MDASRMTLHSGARAPAVAAPSAATKGPAQLSATRRALMARPVCAAPPGGASPGVSQSRSTAGSSAGSGSGSGLAASAAMVAKIAAARELARRLTEERQAAVASATMSSLEDADLPDLLRSAEDASVAAATQAARADSVSRALRSADNSKEQLSRLRAENDALKNLLLELTQARGGTDSISRTRLEAALTSSLVSGQPLSIAGLLQGARGGADGTTLPPPPEPATPFPDTPESVDSDVASIFSYFAPRKTRPSRKEREAEEKRKKAEEAAATAAAVAAAAAAATAAAAAAAVGDAPPYPAPGAAPAAVPAPVTPLAPSIEQLNAQALAAQKAGVSCFTFPASPVPVPGPMWLYYNRSLGPLPQGGLLQLKVGTNKWEAIDVLDMTRAPQEFKPTSVANADWWFIQVALPDDIFKMDYVIMDKNTGLVDNNGYKDFNVPLTGGPTEEQLVERRFVALQQQEARRLQALQQEQDRIRSQVLAGRREEEERARENARSLLEDRHLAAARKVVEQLRPADEEVPRVVEAMSNRCRWLGEGAPAPGQRSQLAFNKSGSEALRHGGSAVLHIGFDGWAGKGVAQVVDMSRASPEQASQLARQASSSGAGPGPGSAGGGGSRAEDWWLGWVEVPLGARSVDWVISDRERNNWDNNSGRDFHCGVKGALSDEQLLQTVLSQVRKENEAADLEYVGRAAEQAVRKLQAKGEALARRLAAKHQVLYTEPAMPQAGQGLDVYYNPELTPLRGRPDVYVHCSWDRGDAGNRHRSQVLHLAPERSTGGLGFQKASLEVPPDAWGMDLTFRDSAEGNGGFVDDNAGLQYHFPITSSSNNGTGPSGRKGAQLSVVHVAVEMAPIAKVGGMGDVVTALGRAVQDEGHMVEVIIPKFDCIKYSNVQGLKQEASFGFNGTTVKVWKGKVEQLPTTFLEPQNGMFWVGCIYGRNDDHNRFKFFCEAAMEYLKRLPRRPDIVHCHDWPTASIAWADRGAMRCVFTIHNLSYGMDLVGRAMARCEVATTVSPTYAREVSGNGAIAPHLGKFYGIRNGIDPELWDPQCDPFLPMPYGPENVTQGKEAARKLLRQKLNLAQVDVPIVSVVTRLVAQKGIHLIKHAAWRAVERGGQFVLLGSAPDPRVQGEFNALREQLVRQYHDRAALVFTYDEPLSHLIYAASDLFLVPSMFEPCGLTQMIAMNYGAMPVVRRTGGLADTVFDLDNDEQRALAAGLPGPNGFVFEGTDAAALDYGLNRAMSTWFQDRQGFRAIQARVMTQDWSWFSPALDYIELYYKALRT